MDLKNFFQELKRRHVVRETIAYIIGAWVILQVSQVVLPAFNAPQWILKALIVFLILGIPLVMAISWAYEITNKGFQRMSELEGKLSPTKHKRFLNTIIILSALVALSLFVAIGSKMKTMSDSPPFSLAILPFKNLSPDRENNWFSEGLRDDIWERMSRIEQMTPISNRSSDKFGKGEKTNEEVMSELNVRYLLDGSIREDTDPVFVRLQLWNSDGKLVWKEDYYRPKDELLKLQKLLSRDIAEAMEFKIGSKEESIFETSETDNLEAYLKVREGMKNARDNRFYVAIQNFQDALIMDSTYANAFAGLSYAYTCLDWSYAKDLLENIEKTKTYAAKALELDPDNALAYISLSTLYSIVEKNNRLEREYLDKALALQPNNPIINYEAGMTYNHFNPPDYEKGLNYLKRAFELEPLDWKTSHFLFIAYLNLGRFDDATEIVNRMSSFFSFSEDQKAYRLAQIESYKVGNRGPELQFWLNKLKKDSLNPDLHLRIAQYYDGNLDDDETFLKHAKRAYELEEQRKERKIGLYISALIENKKFDAVPKLFKTEAFKKRSIEDQGMFRFTYHYSKGDMEALKSLMDSADYYNISLRNRIFYKIKIGEIKEPSDIDSLTMKRLDLDERTRIYAEMGNRDSLYACLNNPLMYLYFDRVNSSDSMDPYRNTPEYIAFEKKYLLNLRH